MRCMVAKKIKKETYFVHTMLHANVVHLSNSGFYIFAHVMPKLL